MNTNAALPDPRFLDRQRDRLTKLRAEIVRATQAKRDEEADINAQSTGEALESEDDAQRLAMLELDGNLVVRDLERLARIDRALRKIEEGTYGLSDLSGEQIPIARLEAVPEAILTLAEQESSERR